MECIDLPGGTLAYLREGHGPLLLLLHANPGDHRDFDAVRPSLARNHEVIALDWPAYGGSPAPADPRTASAMGFAQLLQQFVSAPRLPPAVVLGNSVGGYAAARLALDRPQAVRALALVSPGGFTPHDALSRAFCRIKGNETITRWTTPALAALYLRRRTPVVREILARAAAGQRGAAATSVNAAVWRSFLDPGHDLRERAKEIGVPVWLAFGRKDPIIPAGKDGEAARRAQPGAVFHVFETGHMPFAEDPQAFLAALEPFLAALSP